MARAVTFGEGQTVSFVEDVVSGPAHDQVLVRMQACGICKYDTKTLKDLSENPLYSARPGHEGVGIVEAVGEGVHDLKPGDKIASMALGGAMAEFYLADCGSVARIPDAVERYELWIAEPVACVVNALRLLRIEPGEDVVVLGSGYMGILLVQGLPKEFIRRLVATDLRDDRLDLAKKYGAEYVVNAEKENAVEAVFDICGGKVDLVVEAAGVQGTIAQGTAMLRNGGRLCIFGHHALDEKVPTNDWHMHGIEVLNTTPFMSRDFHRDLVDGVRLMEKGTFDQSELVTHTYPFDEVAAAMEETIQHPPDMIKSVLINS